MKDLKKLLIVITCLLSMSSYGAVIEVINKDDIGPGSLRNAMLGSNSGDTILVNVSGVIPLQSPIILTGKTDVAIIGPYASHLTITRDIGTWSGAQQLIDIQSCENIRFENIGFESGGFSGFRALYMEANSGVNLIQKCVFRDFNVGSLLGGACYFGSMTVDINNCSFYQNTAERGGAIYFNSGQFTFFNCNFISNTANDEGGALFVEDMTAGFLAHNTFTQNISTNSGASVSVANAASGQILMSSNASALNGGTQQFYDQSVTGHYSSNGGNVVRLVGAEFVPFGPNGSDYFNNTVNTGFGNLITDGFGLIYYQQVDSNSHFVDRPNLGGTVLPGFDCRRAPRNLTGIAGCCPVGPSLVPISDAGAVEYTKLRVIDNSGDPAMFGTLGWCLERNFDFLNYVEFDGPYTILPDSELTEADYPTYIDGYSVNNSRIPGPRDLISAGVQGANIQVEIENGNGLNVGLRFISLAHGSKAAGLRIVGFNEFGIAIQDCDNIEILGSEIGITSSGNDYSNGQSGITIFGGLDNQIGGKAHWKRNVISANGGVNFNSNIFLDGPSQGTRIFGNFIGTIPNGIGAPSTTPTNSYGIRNEGLNNVIGAQSLLGGNLISGLEAAGVYESGSTGSIIQHNTIGLDIDGTVSLANGDGIFISDNASSIMLGGTQQQKSRNIISGNNNANVHIRFSNTVFVYGNWIGLDINGLTGPGGTPDGVLINDANVLNVLIGGTAAFSGNVISQNINGVHVITTGGAVGMYGNYIGTNNLGNVASGNSDKGIWVESFAQPVAIGGPGAGNVISGQDAASAIGIHLDGGGGTGHFVQSNIIGLRADGVAAIPNQTGIRIEGASNTTVGGLITSFEGNTISGNNGNGIEVENGASTTNIQGNLIGTAITGNSNLGNFGHGIKVNGSDGTLIGGGVSTRNVISGHTTNTMSGIFLSGIGFTTINSNKIGTNAAGTIGIGNHIGIRIVGTHGVALGGISGTENYICDSDSVGVHILSPNVQMNGNYVGFGTNDITGGMANLFGCVIQAPNVQIGNLGSNFVNHFSNSVQHGIVVTGDASDFVTINAVKVGIDSSGGPAGNLQNGILINEADFTAVGQISPNSIIGSGNAGVHIQGNSTDNHVMRTTIGDFSGNAAAFNFMGILIDNGANNNEIGDVNILNGNTIVSCLQEGINLDNAQFNTIHGNFIGTDAANADGGNNKGIALSNSDNNDIGGDYLLGPADHNIISYNDDEGILLDNSHDNDIFGNFVGMMSDGATPAPNTEGIVLFNNSNNNLIGDLSGFINYGNVISGNDQNGIIIDNSDSNLVAFNLIGVDTGFNPTSAQAYGVHIMNGSTENIIGGDYNLQHNKISGNINNGVIIDNSPSNFVLGNIIGDNFTQDVGVTIVGAGSQLNEIGNFPANQFGNRILDHGVAGIEIYNEAFDNFISQNYIGLDETLNGGSSNGIQSVGIAVHTGAGSNNYLGLNAPDGGNVISSNNIGILLDGVSSQNVYNNFIGTDTTGMSIVQNSSDGISIINGSMNNNIGGPGVDETNLISGNPIGVRLADPTTSFNLVTGNVIGLNALLTDTLANGIGVGIELGANNNHVGNVGSGNGNVIAGNIDGVVIDGATTNFVQNNIIGGAFANNNGVLVQNGSSNNQIGGDSNAMNLISGNNFLGVGILNSTQNKIFGNIVGLESNGTTANPNLVGIYLNTATDNEIGSPSPDFGNLISANTIAGIALESNSNVNTIQSNFIGTDFTGNDTIGNGIGIVLDSSHNNLIGGDWNADQGNVVCGNLTEGIYLWASTGDTIIGNNIGLSQDNGVYLGNLGNGVELDGGSNGNFVGLAGIGLENVITSNANGIYVYSSIGNTITNNFIGNDDTGGQSPLPSGTNNQGIGIALDTGSVANIIEGKNVISGNVLAGVAINGLGSNFNIVRGNNIGVDFDGNNAYDNDSTNVLILDGAKNNLIGGATAADKNILGGNSVIHVYIRDTGTDSNQVAGNNIGLGFNDVTTYSSEYGVAIADDARQNIIGGSFAGEGNNITDFDVNGILILDAPQNKILGNRIGIKPDDSSAPIDSAGIALWNADNTWIGSIAPASDSINVITNCNRGVEITNGFDIFFNNTYGAVVGGNKIYNNTYQGIDINADDMVLPNDTTNNNGGLNNGEIDWPELVSSWTCGGTTKVGFKYYSSNTLANYNIQIYQNSPANADPSGWGEGETYMGNWIFTAGTNYDTITIDLGTPLPVGTIITATITGVLGNTSEFSQQDTVTTVPNFLVTGIPETCLGAGDASIEIDAPEAVYFSTDGFITDYYGIDGDTLTVSSGSYMVEMEYLNGCVLDTTITINPGPPLPFGTSVVADTCGAGGMITFDTTSTNLTGGTGNYLYSFNDGTDFLNPIDTNGVITGDYFLALLDTSLGCYSDTLTINVPLVNDFLDESFDFDDFCPGGTPLPSNIATPGGYFDFEIVPGDGAMIDSLSGLISGSTVGTMYNVIYTVGQCDEKDTVVVTAAAIDDSSFVYTDYCEDGSATITPTLNGGTWVLLSGPGIIDSITGVITGPDGIYEVQYTTNGTCPSIATDSITVFDKPAGPGINTTQTLYCRFDSLAEMSTTFSGGGLAWYDDSGLTNQVGTGTTFTPSSITQGDNYFYLAYVDINGCTSEADSANYFGSDVSGLFAGPDQEVCIGSTVQLEAFGGATYNWSTSGQILDDTTLADPLARIVMTEEFIVTITDLNGCSVVDTINITLTPQDQCSVDTWNAFSPNNDGKNDLWIIDGIEGFGQNTVIIYNRWGDVLRKFENYDNSIVVWDGTNKKNKIVPMGTYFYVIEVGGGQDQAGWVQVMR